ncbi:glycosyltransferase [Oricola cellulosilytica]|uniref:Glycosyltransferase n=1 Tax=Oricola cellulosilytica TaxID=1429082 RepID=A0A4R0PMN5_9HYPH|nr:glycosyltransferase [Oricola cellulosilytica]TCD16569.1 glycosyltransferase [Oricola cellulosilytica]
MHLVLVSSLIPSGPPESGFEIANQAIIEGLRRVGVKVTLLGFKWPDASLSYPENSVCLGEVDVKTDTSSLPQKLRWLGKAVAGGLTFSSAKLRIVSQDKLREAIASIGPFDGFVLNGAPLAGAFEEILTSRPFIFVAHNVEHVSAAQNAGEAASPVERLLFRREASVLKALERRLCDKAQFVLTLADDDIAPLGLSDSARVRSVPLTTPAAPNAGKPRTPAFDTGMIGTWTWAPNRIGLEWFLQNVVPRLHPDLSIAIAGKLPSGFPQRDPRVRFLGRVDDAKEFMRQCRVISLASRAGTGIQLKTIETLELGLPAVATPSSLRGIAEKPDNLLQADDAAGFAEQLQSHVVGQRTGTVKDVDGRVFRATQQERMDEVLRFALGFVIKSSL